MSEKKPANAGLFVVNLYTFDAAISIYASERMFMMSINTASSDSAIDDSLLLNVSIILNDM